MIELVNQSLKEVKSMSKADKMFADLGYVKSLWNNCERFTWGTGDINLEITFYDGTIHANHFLHGNISEGSMALTKDNLKAINLKMKELGWLYE